MGETPADNSAKADAEARLSVRAADEVSHPIIQRAPLVAAAAAMAGGIVAGRYVPVAVGLWAAVAVAAFVTACATFRRERLASLTAAAVGCAIFCGGAISASLAWRCIGADHIYRFAAPGKVLATIRGRVVSTPQIRQHQGAYWQPPKTCFLLDVTGIRRADGRWMGASGSSRVTVGEPVHDLAGGDEVELVGTLRRVPPPRNPGQYDWRAADRKRGILVRFSVPGADGVGRLSAADGVLPRQLLWRLRGLARGHLAGSGAAGEATLVEALVLGERDPALRRLNQAMIEAGVAHMLSISGLHLGVFLGFVYCLCRLLSLRPRRAAAVVLVVLLAYVLLAEPRPPLLRAAIMAAAICVAVISGRAVSIANALAAAAIVLLAADPLQLFTPGFQLSFGIVCGIMLLRRPIRRLLFGRWLRRRGLMVFRNEHPFRRWVYYSGANWLIGLVSVSVAAHVTAVPLVAYHFGLFAPWASLLSVFLLPMLVMVLVPAYVSMALAWPMPNLAAAIGEAATAAAGLLAWAVRAAGRLPWLSFEVFAVPVWLVVLCYAAMVLWAVRPRRRLLIAAAVAAALVGVIFTQRPAPPPANPQLHVLDVSHGQMALLHATDGKTYLFDAGSLGQADPYHSVLRPFLRARRLPPPEAVFISHANVDHFNAVTGLLDHHPPQRVYLNEYFGRGDDQPPEVRQLMSQLARRGVKVVRLGRGQSVSLAGAGRVEVLWPPPPSAEADELSVNDRSLVLRLLVGGRSVLIPGDAGQGVQKKLAKLPAGRIGCDVMILPHHGTFSPAMPTLLAATGAKLLIQSSAGRIDRQEFLRAIDGRRRCATFRDGWIAVELGGEGLAVETMRQAAPAAAADLPE